MRRRRTWCSCAGRRRGDCAVPGPSAVPDRAADVAPHQGRARVLGGGVPGRREAHQYAERSAGVRGAVQLQREQPAISRAQSLLVIAGNAIVRRELAQMDVEP